MEDSRARSSLPNETKLSDGHRERRSKREGFSHAKGERTTGGRSLQRLVRRIGVHVEQDVALKE
jgi:hypothetical protein